MLYSLLFGSTHPALSKSKFAPRIVLGQTFFGSLQDAALVKDRLFKIVRTSRRGTALTYFPAMSQFAAETARLPCELFHIFPQYTEFDSEAVLTQAASLRPPDIFS